MEDEREAWNEEALLWSSIIRGPSIAVGFLLKFRTTWIYKSMVVEKALSNPKLNFGHFMKP